MLHSSRLFISALTIAAIVLAGLFAFEGSAEACSKKKNKKKHGKHAKHAKVEKHHSKKDGHSKKHGKKSPADDGDGSCGECDGKFTDLTLRYNGADAADVVVEQKKDQVQVFAAEVGAGESFSFVGTYKGSLGTEISIYVDGALNTKIHTSCSVAVEVGMAFGDFVVLAGTSKNGGPLCGGDDCQDEDGDGVTTCDGDCDDANPGVYPGAPELCNDLDDDCDGIVDEDSGAIGDLVFNDLDHDGELGADEEGLNGVIVTLYADLDTDGSYETQVATQQTVGGAYLFEGLAAGLYLVEVDETSLPDIGADEEWLRVLEGNTLEVAVGDCEVRDDLDFPYFHAWGCMKFEKTGPETAVVEEWVTFTYTIENCGSVWLAGGVHVYDKLANPSGDNQVVYLYMEPNTVEVVEVEVYVGGWMVNENCADVTADGYPVSQFYGYEDVELPLISIVQPFCMDVSFR